MFKNEFQNISYKVFSLISKDYFENPIPTLHFANKALLAQLEIFLKILFYFEN
jgi:hypothetical protein